MAQHIGGREPRLHVAKNVEDHFRRGHGFADVDSVDQIVGQARPGHHAALLHAADEGDLELRQFAVDLFLRRRFGQRIGDHAAHIGQRGLPVFGNGREADEGRIRAAADVLLFDLRIEVGAACPRPRFQPPVDDRLRDGIDQQAFVIDDGVIHRPPRAHDGIGQRARQVAFDQNCGLANRRNVHRCIGAAADWRDGVTESGCLRSFARDVPIGKILLHQTGEDCRIGIARDDDGGVFRPVPVAVKVAHRFLRRAPQSSFRADGEPFGQALPCEQGPARFLSDPIGRPAAFALLGQNNGHLGGKIGGGKCRFAHHAGQQAEAFIQAGGRRAGQVQLVNRVCRTGFGIGIAAECRAKALPARDRLAILKIFAFTEHQMLDQMGKALLRFLFVQRPCIDADADRHLPRRHAILAHGIAQTIVDLAEIPFRILRNVAAAIEPRSLAGLQILRCGHFGHGGRNRHLLRRRGLRMGGNGDERDERKESEPALDARRKCHGRNIGCTGLKLQ